MKFYLLAAAVLLVAPVTGFGQSSPSVEGHAAAPSNAAGPVARSARMPMTAHDAASAAPTPVSLREREDEMEGTVTKMHDALELMRKKAVLSKDPAAKANLELWSLMVTHLQEELKDLKVSVAVHDDMEARRAAMYKQADAKAQAAAQEAMRKKFDQNGSQSTGSQVTPAQPSAAGTSSAPASSSKSTPK